MKLTSSIFAVVVFIATHAVFSAKAQETAMQEFADDDLYSEFEDKETTSSILGDLINRGLSASDLDSNEINEIDDQDELADEIDRYLQVGDEEELDSEDLDSSAMPTSSYKFRTRSPTATEWARMTAVEKADWERKAKLRRRKRPPFFSFRNLLRIARHFKRELAREKRRVQSRQRLINRQRKRINSQRKTIRSLRTENRQLKRNISNSSNSTNGTNQTVWANFQLWKNGWFCSDLKLQDHSMPGMPKRKTNYKKLKVAGPEDCYKKCQAYNKAKGWKFNMFVTWAQDWGKRTNYCYCLNKGLSITSHKCKWWKQGSNVKTFRVGEPVNIPKNGSELLPTPTGYKLQKNGYDCLDNNLKHHANSWKTSNFTISKCLNLCEQRMRFRVMKLNMFEIQSSQSTGKSPAGVSNEGHVSCVCFKKGHTVTQCKKWRKVPAVEWGMKRTSKVYSVTYGSGTTHPKHPLPKGNFQLWKTNWTCEGVSMWGHGKGKEKVATFKNVHGGKACYKKCQAYNKAKGWKFNMFATYAYSYRHWKTKKIVRQGKCFCYKKGISITSPVCRWWRPAKNFKTFRVGEPVNIPNNGSSLLPVPSGYQIKKTGVKCQDRGFRYYAGGWQAKNFTVSKCFNLCKVQMRMRIMKLNMFEVHSMKFTGSTVPGSANMGAYMSCVCFKKGHTVGSCKNWKPFKSDKWHKRSVQTYRVTYNTRKRRSTTGY